MHRSESEQIKPPIDRRWWFALAAIAALGLGIRLLYVSVHTRQIAILSDASYYHIGANLLAEGRGFIDPYYYALDHGTREAAGHPPGYMVVLSLASLIGFKSVLAHQIWSALISTAAVVMMGLAGRRLAGARVGLLAAGFAAVYPSFWFSDGLLLSETLLLLVMAVTTLLAYRLWERPTFGRAAALGAACAVAALTRAEAVLLLPFLVAPLILLLRRHSWAQRIRLLALAGASALAVVAPWVAFNMARFKEPVYLSISDHTLLAGNCPDRYKGNLVGFWSLGCVVDLNCPLAADRARGQAVCLRRVKDKDWSVQELRYRKAAMTNIRNNLTLLPFVVFAREGRVWGYFRPAQQLELDKLTTRELGLSQLNLWMYYGLMVFGIGGIVVLRRRRVPLLPLLAPVAAVVISAAVTFGETRYRALAEVAIVLAASVGVDALITRLGGKSPPMSDHRDDDIEPDLEPVSPAGEHR